MHTFVWLGIGFCVTQSAMFSGLNLAFFSISKLRLEIESKKNNKHAIKISALRKDSNFLLTTILWGNVGINVLLTLLSNSVMLGVVAFVFSTFVITFFGEIMPQAYFSRHAMQTASLLSPLIRFYQFLLYPLAKPTAVILDKWLGQEMVQYFQEKDLHELLKMHVKAAETDIEKVEGKGAINFLAMDDLSIGEEGEPIAPDSIIRIEYRNGRAIFPIKEFTCNDVFLKSIQKSQKKWVILTDEEDEPHYALNADSFLRAAFFEKTSFNALEHCHKPIIIKDVKAPLGDVIVHLKVHPERDDDDVVDEDLIMLWSDEQRKIITGSDVLGRLLRGIAQHEKSAYRIIKSA